MYVENANIFKSRSHALQGGAFGLLLVIISLLSVRVGRIEASLIFLPLISIYLWPRNAASGVSASLIFLMGIMVDILSGGPLGLWAFLYLFMFGAFRPDLRGRDTGVYRLWPVFLLWVGVSVVVLLLIGALFIPGRTLLWSLLVQAMVAVVLFPGIYLLQSVLLQFMVDPDDPERAA